MSNIPPLKKFPDLSALDMIRRGITAIAHSLQIPINRHIQRSSAALSISLKFNRN